jgi:hypothetical protein
VLQALLQVPFESQASVAPQALHNTGTHTPALQVKFVGQSGSTLQVHAPPTQWPWPQSTQTPPPEPQAASLVPSWQDCPSQQPPLQARPPAQLAEHLPPPLGQAVSLGQSLALAQAQLQFASPMQAGWLAQLVLHDPASLQPSDAGHKTD